MRGYRSQIMESFAKKVKEQLSAEETKKKCCKFTENSMIELSSRKKEDVGAELGEIFEKCRCDACRLVFLRHLFIIFGGVTDPEKSYHLDFTFCEEGSCAAAEKILLSMGFDFRRTMRRAKHVLYMKDSASIEDFLASIGASSAAFDVMNSKIVREFRNSVNRQVNCDTANIEKQLAAGKKYIEAIRRLVETDKMDSLPEDLRETARIRYENEQISLTELGRLLTPQVSKSGVRHRLERILEFYRETLENQDQE